MSYGLLTPHLTITDRLTRYHGKYTATATTAGTYVNVPGITDDQTWAVVVTGGLTNKIKYKIVTNYVVVYDYSGLNSQVEFLVFRW